MGCAWHCQDNLRADSLRMKTTARYAAVRMAKTKTSFVCSACGHREPKWLGQCPACNAWNTLQEQTQRSSGSTQHSEAVVARPLHTITSESSARASLGMKELDRALGGGAIPGSTILLGGDPGIGKSTLLLQAAVHSSVERPLYVSAEESAVQLRARADRIGAGDNDLAVLCTTRFEDVQAELERTRPHLVIIDSLQTLVAEEAGSVPGSVGQVRLITHELAQWARVANSIVVLVAHVTKDGQIAGPKVVEHMVDVVLRFDASENDIRLLHAGKNRYGAIDEVGIMAMGAKGLSDVTDPQSLLAGVGKQRPAGVVVAPSYQGSRALMLELQALTVAAMGSVSRTFSDRVDPRRVSRVAAVLERHVGLRFSDQDLYVNVAGGVRVQDVGLDLALALALYSARTGVAVPAGLTAVGELSLAGEIRAVAQREQRLRAAFDLGFTNCIGPVGQTERGWIAADTVHAAVQAAFTEHRSA